MNALTPASRRTIGVVDYGVGNHTSVRHTLQALGHRCRVTADQATLAAADVLVLPGVGAFRAAMEKLHAHDLVEFLRERARAGQPMIGLCLGMQLMAEGSYEHGYTAGLDLIPGQVVPFDQARWHIGWNVIEVVGGDPMFRASDRQSMYFNHSHVFDADPEFRMCLARITQPFTVGVRRGNLVGLQFHPEKSQVAGRDMLRNLVEGLCG